MALPEQGGRNVAEPSFRSLPWHPPTLYRLVDQLSSGFTITVVYVPIVTAIRLPGYFRHFPRWVILFRLGIFLFEVALAHWASVCFVKFPRLQSVRIYTYHNTNQSVELMFTWIASSPAL